MDLQQSIALAVLAVVLVVSAARWTQRALAALAGAVILAAADFAGGLLPEVLLTAAGLTVLASYLKRSGITSWLALKAAKAGRGRPGPILVLTGLLAYGAAAFWGPVAAVALIVPVVLLLAVELDVPPLPFVVVLAWAALLGGATTMTSQPGNLWLASVLSLDGGTWLQRVLPFTAAGMAATLLTAFVVFRKQLRVTNERRARVLEYDEAQSLSDLPLLWKTLSVMVLVAAGLIAGPWLKLSPALVTVGGAVLLWLLDSPRSNLLEELDGLTLLYFGGLMVVAGAVAASGLPQVWSAYLPNDPRAVLAISALLGALVEHGAVAGILAPFLAPAPELWPFVILGTSVGAGITVLGASSTAAALALAGGTRKPGWRDYTKYGLVFAAVNLVVVSALSLLR